MKKLLFTLLSAAVVAAAFCSCDREDPVEQKEIKIESLMVWPSLAKVYDDGEEIGKVQDLEKLWLGYSLSLPVNISPVDANEEMAWFVESEKGLAVISLEEQYNHGRLETFSVSGLEGEQEVTVWAQSKSGVMSPKTVLKFYPNRLEKVVLDEHHLTMTKGSEHFLLLDFHVFPEEAEAYFDTEDVKWSASDGLIINPDYVQLDDTECCIAGGPVGTHTVTVDVLGHKDQCVVEIVDKPYVPLESLTFDLNRPHPMRVGYEYVLTIVPTPSNATDFSTSWKIDESSTGTVNIVSVTNRELTFIPTTKGNVTFVVKSDDGIHGDSFTYEINYDMKIPDGFVDLGYRNKNGEPTFFTEKFLGTPDSPDTPGLYAWGDPEPYGFVRDGKLTLDKAKYFNIEYYKWWNGKSLPESWKNTEWRKFLSAGFLYHLNDGTDPVQKQLGEMYYTPSPAELTYLKKCYIGRADGKIIFNGGGRTLTIDYPVNVKGWEKTEWIYLPSDDVEQFLDFTYNFKEWYETGYELVLTNWCIYPWEGFTFLPVWRGFYDPDKK